MPKYNLVIDERFRIWPHPNREELKQAIIRAGRIEEAIEIISGDRIVDGITRYEIAQELQYDFPVKKRDFKDDDEAELWAREKQGSRRNLSQQQVEENIHAMMKLAKQPHGANLPRVSLKRKNCALDKPSGKTSERVAKAVGKSPRTVELIEKRQDIIQSMPKAIQLHYKKTGEKLTDAQWKALDAYENIGEVATNLSGKRAPDIKTAYEMAAGKKLSGTKAKPAPAADNGQAPDVKKQIGGVLKSIVKHRAAMAEWCNGSKLTVKAKTEIKRISKALDTDVYMPLDAVGKGLG